jgi:trimethylamine:corrinoid methyltransferase-like protein
VNEWNVSGARDLQEKSIEEIKQCREKETMAAYDNEVVESIEAAKKLHFAALCKS